MKVIAEKDKQRALVVDKSERSMDLITKALGALVPMAFKEFRKGFQDKDKLARKVIERAVRESSESIKVKYPEMEILNKAISNEFFIIQAQWVKNKKKYDPVFFLELHEKLKNSEVVYHTDQEYKEKIKNEFIELFRENAKKLFQDNDELKTATDAEHQLFVEENLYGVRSDIVEVHKDVRKIIERFENTSHIETEMIDDSATSEKLKELEKLRLDRDHVRGLRESKIFLRGVDQKNTYLLDRAYCYVMNFYLMGGREDWQSGADYFEASASGLKSKNSYVIYAGILSNLGRTHLAREAIEQISSTDIQLLSKERLESYYRIKSIIEVNLGELKLARETVEKCPNQDKAEVKYIKLLAGTGYLKANLTSIANELASGDDHNHIIVAGGYLSSRYTQLVRNECDPFIAEPELYIAMMSAFSALGTIVPLLETREELDAIITYGNLGLAVKNPSAIFEHSELIDKYAAHSDALKVNLGISYFHLKDYSGCFKYLSITSLELLINNQIFDLLLDSARISGELKFIQDLEQVIEDLVLSEELKAKSLLEIHNQIDSDEIMLSQTQIAYASYSESSWAIIRHSEALARNNQVEEGRKVLEDAVSRKKNDLNIAVTLARYYQFHVKDIDLAINSYRKLINSNTPREVLTNFLSLLIDNKKANEALETINALESLSGDYDLLKCKAFALSRIGKSSDAVEVFRSIAHQMDNDPITLHNYANALARLGLLDEEFIENERYLELRPGDVDTLLRQSRLLVMKEGYPEAFELAKKAYLIEPLNPRVTGYIFGLTTDMGQTNAAYLLEENFDLVREVTTHELVNNANGMVVEIFKIFDEDGNADFSKVKNILESKENAEKEIYSITEQYGLPLSFASKKLGRDIYDTWGAITSGYSKTKLAADNTPLAKLKETHDLLSSIHGSNRIILIDSIALLTFGFMEKLDVLRGTGFRFGISSETKYTFLEKREAHKRNARGDSGYVGTEDGELKPSKFNPAQIEANLKLVNDILDFIDSYEILTTPEDFEQDLPSVEIDSLTTEFKALAYFSREPSFIIYTGDGGFKNTIEELGKIHLGTNVFLIWLLGNSLISTEVYVEIVGSLLINNYTGIQYHPETIVSYYAANLSTDKSKRIIERVLSCRDFEQSGYMMSFFAHIYYMISKVYPSVLNGFLLVWIENDSDNARFLDIFAQVTYRLYSEDEKVTQQEKTNVDESFNGLGLKYGDSIINSETSKKKYMELHIAEARMKATRLAEKLGIK